MVKEIFKDNGINGKVKKFIEERIATYYPQLSSNKSIHIEEISKPERHHCSIIYEFRTCNDNHVLKNLIVKKRIFNHAYQNDVIKGTENEFINLSFINSLSGTKLSAPRVLDASFEDGILITEKVEGRSFYSYLRELSCSRLTENRLRLLEDISFKAGEWLRAFHNIPSKQEERRIDAQEFIDKTEMIADKLTALGISENSTRLLIDKMKRLKKHISDACSSVTLKHGDFQPKNIMYHNNEVTVLDMNSKNKDVSLRDVSHFLSHIHLFNLKYIFSSLNNGVLNKLSDKFLKGYFADQEIDYSAVEFFMCLKLLTLMEFTCRRNKSFLKRVRFTYFYEKQIKEFMRRIGRTK